MSTDLDVLDVAHVRDTFLMLYMNMFSRFSDWTTHAQYGGLRLYENDISENTSD